MTFDFGRNGGKGGEIEGSPTAQKKTPGGSGKKWEGSLLRTYSGVLCGALLGFVLMAAGCETPPPPPPSASSYRPTDTIVINEGDTLSIVFPGAKGLDTTQEVRRDGRISLAAGEVMAAGQTPAKLAEVLAQMYARELVSKDVNVTVVSSSVEVTVSGAVGRPGKIISKRPLTALEAVMEAGGFNSTKANRKRVTVVRRDGEKEYSYTLDLEQVLEGAPSTAFFLKPFDMVYVPEKINWF